MRVRISFDALRLCLLVAAGVTSGYLWRAAFESSSPEIRLAGRPRVVQQAPAPPVVRVQPTRVTPQRQAVRHRTAVRPRGRRVQPAPEQLASQSAGPAAKPAPTPKQPKPGPSSPPPAPAPTPPPTTTTTPAQPAPPVQAAAAPSPAPTPPPTPPPTSGSSDETRPGWVKGDDNHDHTGPGHKGH